WSSYGSIIGRRKYDCTAFAARISDARTTREGADEVRCAEYWQATENRWRNYRSMGLGRCFRVSSTLVHTKFLKAGRRPLLLPAYPLSGILELLGIRSCVAESRFR